MTLITKSIKKQFNCLFIQQCTAIINSKVYFSGGAMKKSILSLLLGLTAITSTSIQANDWGNWGDRQKGRVESARICGKNGYIFNVRDTYYVAKYVSGKRFAVGVPVKARFGKNKWIKMEGISNDGTYLIKRKYYSLANAKLNACGLNW